MALLLAALAAVREEHSNLRVPQRQRLPAVRGHDHAALPAQEVPDQLLAQPAVLRWTGQREQRQAAERWGAAGRAGGPGEHLAALRDLALAQPGLQGVAEFDRQVTDPQLRGWQRPVDHRARHRPQLDPRQSAAVAVSGKQRRAPHLPWRRRRLRSELYGGPTLSS